MCLEDMKNVFALRIWIVDNSGSMQKVDGHRIIQSPAENGPNAMKMVPSTRWEEIVECVEYHVKLAGIIEAPTQFRLLNNPGSHIGTQKFSIADNDSDKNGRYTIAQQVDRACRLMHRARPDGCTPLADHIYEIHHEISQMATELRRQGKKVAITIATDGLPTNECGIGGTEQNNEFVDALRMLEGLPVWVVIRLCTDEDEVVEFYNDLDAHLELSLEVLDDFRGEAAEMNKTNPWLNYGLSLHRLREFGFHDRLFDMLDERPLLKSEIRDFSLLLFGKEHLDGMADPSIDWSTFLQDITRLLNTESYQCNPMTKRAAPWINTARLDRIHGSFPALNIMRNEVSSSCGCNIM